MTSIWVRNWDKWQSYRRDRGSPPWIKVHRKLMSNRDWSMLSDAEKGQLVSLWIAAADNGGRLPADPKILRKICILDDIPDIEKFTELGFLTTEPPTDDAADGVTVTPKRRHGDAPEAEEEEEERRGEERQKEEATASSCAEPLRDAAPAAVSIPLNDRSEYGVSLEQIREWRDLYPAVDVVQELRNMRGWSIANASKRKTRRGVLRFIHAWLSREQDDASKKSRNGNGRNDPQPRKTALQRAEEDYHRAYPTESGTTEADDPPLPRTNAGALPGSGAGGR